MIQPLLLALCFGVGPPPLDTPAAAFARLRKKAYSQRFVDMKFGPRFAEHARKYPGDSSAVEALLLAASFSSTTSDVHKQALARLEKHYARSAVVVPLLRNLGLSLGHNEAAFLRQIGDT